MESENTVKVVVRCRPLDKKEIKKGMKPILNCDFNRKEVAIQTEDVDKSMSYYFDKVFNSSASQEFVYRSVVADVVEDTLKGFNCTVFAYGQTGTGKTYTMEGYRTESKDKQSPFWYGDQAGMIPRAAQHIFQRLEACSSSFSVLISCLELYNEEVIDLLAKEGDTSKLYIRDETSNSNVKGVTVAGLQEIRVKSPEDIFKILKHASQKRHVAETNSNYRSSRSHCIFTITINMKEAADNGEDLMRTGKLNLVDLAGSENTKRSGAKGVVMKQATMINKSLLTLRRVITALSSGKQTHIPFRDSKLTRLLQESLGGKAKTCMIATIAPTSDCLEETRSTLQYALSAKNIKTTPVVYEKITKKAKIKEYEIEIESLKNQLAASCAADGFWMEQKEWQEYLSNLEKYKELTTNLENTELHISQLESQSESRLEEISICEEDCKQGTEDLVTLQDELQLAKEECALSGDKIDDQRAIVFYHKKTIQQLQEQAEYLRNQYTITINDLNYLHDSLERYQYSLEEGREHSLNSQKDISSLIINTLQKLSTFEQAHQMHESKIGESWNEIIQQQSPMMNTIQKEKDNLKKFTMHQIEIMEKAVQNECDTQLSFESDEHNKHVHFTEDLSNEQRRVFKSILKRVRLLQDSFIEYNQFLSMWKTKEEQKISKSLELQLQYIVDEQKFHREHHNILGQYSASHSSTSKEQQETLRSIYSSIDNAVEKSHESILSDIKELLEDNAKEQSEILQSSLNSVAIHIDDHSSFLEEFEAKQGTLIVEALDNLKKQQKQYTSNSSILKENLNSLLKEGNQHHQIISSAIHSLHSETKEMKDNTAENWKKFQEWKNIHYQEQSKLLSEDYSELDKQLQTTSKLLQQFHEEDSQYPIDEWNLFIENHPFSTTLENAYSRNEKLLMDQKTSLEELQGLLNEFSSQLHSYKSQGNTPKKTKEYTFPQAVTLQPVTNPNVRTKKRKGSTRSSTLGRVNSNINVTNKAQDNNEKKVRTKSIAQKRSIVASKRTEIIKSSGEDLPAKKRRRLGEVTNSVRN